MSDFEPGNAMDLPGCRTYHGQPARLFLSEAKGVGSFGGVPLGRLRNPFAFDKVARRCTQDRAARRSFFECRCAKIHGQDFSEAFKAGVTIALERFDGRAEVICVGAACSGRTIGHHVGAVRDHRSSVRRLSRKFGRVTPSCRAGACEAVGGDRPSPQAHLISLANHCLAAGEDRIFHGFCAGGRGRCSFEKRVPRLRRVEFTAG